MALYDIGDQVELTIYVTTDAGVAATATVTCTITLPDGTTTSPTPTTPVTGTYEISYAAAQAGTHYVKWSATSIGGVSGENDIFEDSFTVSASNDAFISLDEAKSRLNILDTADDDELLAYIETACDLAQIVANQTFARTTFTAETHTTNGYQVAVQLKHRPIISVTSVSELGTALTASDYRIDATPGMLYRRSGYTDFPWAEGAAGVSVTYVAGYAIIPPRARQATLDILAHLWTTQRNNAQGARPSARDDYPVAGTNWYIPNRCRDVLLEMRLHGIA